MGNLHSTRVNAACFPGHSSSGPAPSEVAAQAVTLPWSPGGQLCAIPPPFPSPTDHAGVDIFAPGSDITSAGIASNTASAVLSGTSQAAPHVTGAVAIILGQNPDLTPDQVKARLVAGGAPISFSPSTAPVFLQVSFAGARGPPLHVNPPQPLCDCSQPSPHQNSPCDPLTDAGQHYLIQRMRTGSCCTEILSTEYVLTVCTGCRQAKLMPAAPPVTFQ